MNKVFILALMALLLLSGCAQKLFDMGYTNVCEFGWINIRTGEIVTEKAPTEGS